MDASARLKPARFSLTPVTLFLVLLVLGIPGISQGKNGFPDDTLPPVTGTASLPQILALYQTPTSSAAALETEIVTDPSLCGPLQNRYQLSLVYPGTWEGKPAQLRFLLMLSSQKQLSQLTKKVAAAGHAGGEPAGGTASRVEALPACLREDSFQKTFWNVQTNEVTFQPVRRPVSSRCKRTKDMPDELPSRMQLSMPLSQCALGKNLTEPDPLRNRGR